MNDKKRQVLYKNLPVAPSIPSILILNPDHKERESLAHLSKSVGPVQTASTLVEAARLAASKNFHILIVDSTLGSYALLKDMFDKTTAVIITGHEEQGIKEKIKDWPPDRSLDFCLLPLAKPASHGFLQSLQKSFEHSRLTLLVETFRRALERNETELKEAFTQITEIKKSIQNSVVKELEKRVAIETKYVWYKKEKLRIEDIIKRIYTAQDVTSLWDIVYDIKEIIKARSISLYLLEESPAQGKFLKPLVWDSAILSHADSSQDVIPIDSQDFAASVAYYSREINIAEFAHDKRLSPRYTQNLKFPLKSILSVPIMHDRKVIGVLELYNKVLDGQTQNKGFFKDDEQMMRTLSEHISLAITKLNLIQYDPLTGLLRPDPFLEKVVQKLKLETKRHEENKVYSLVMGDVDWFKNYNDRNGHEAGNRLLRELGGILKSSIREEDLLCRYGGEEFLFFLTNLRSRDESTLFTERIRKNVEDYYFPYQEHQPRNNLTMSFGITNFTKDRFKAVASITEAELKKLAHEADMALLEAKGQKSLTEGAAASQGFPLKNRISIFQRELFDRRLRDQDAASSSQAGADKRKHPRLITSNLLLYREDGSHKVTRTINLSPGGAKIRTDTEIPIDRLLDLILILDEQTCHSKGQVRYCVRGNENFSYFYSGIKFTDLPIEDRQVLENYLNSLLKKSSLSSLRSY